MTTDVFISYSHKDDALRLELVEHLSTLQRQQVIGGWHDRQILAGEEWAGEIDEHLNSAGVVLLLVSASFNASNYCYDIEMARALERHDTGEAIVIPIILRDCDWQSAPFSRLQALPRDARPITSHSNRDEAFAEVARGIRAAVEKLQAGRAPSPAASPARSRPRPLLPYLCNRSDQEMALGPSLREHRLTRPRRPIVCIVHGDEREAHGWFLERHVGVSGIVLPELRAIPRGDVDAWSRHDEVREFRRIEEREIRALYERADLRDADGRIAMELLAEELKQLLHRAA